MTGKLLNIKDAYSHPLFYRGVDEDTGFVTRNILCFPIKDDTGILGEWESNVLCMERAYDIMLPINIHAFVFKYTGYPQYFLR